jgi:predicted lipoprotein with Yx(FWY)xxD motif
MSRAKVLAAFVLTLLVSVIFAACGTTSGASASTPAPTATTAPAPTVTPPPPVTVIKVKTAKVSGKNVQVLGDLKDKTLYYFKNDSAGTVTCTGACAKLWPPLLAASGTPAATTTLSGKLDVVTGSNGRQVTYNGHPLYTYSKDGDPEDAYGQGFGGVWFVATQDLAATY